MLPFRNYCVLGTPHTSGCVQFPLGGAIISVALMGEWPGCLDEGHFFEKDTDVLRRE